MSDDARTFAKRGERNQLAAALTKGPNEVLDFFLPLWVGSQLGATPAQVGALTAAETLISLLVRPMAGALADRHDRGRLAACGALLYGLSFVGYALTPSLGPAFLAAVLGGAGGAVFWVALRARVGEDLAKDDAAYSALFAAEGAGTWVAFVAALFLVHRIDYRGVYWVGAAACLIAAVVLLEPARRSSEISATGLAQSPRMRQLGRRLAPMLAVVAITAMAEAGVALLLLMHLQRGHHLELGEIAAVFLPGFIVYSTLPEYLHEVVRRLGRTWVLALAMLCGALFAAGLSFAPHPWVIAAMWILAAVAFAAAVPVEQAIVAEAAGVSLGRAMGIYESATLLGATVGTLSAGLLYGGGNGWQVACLAAAAVLLVSAVMVPAVVRRVGVAERPPPRARSIDRARPIDCAQPIDKEPASEEVAENEPTKEARQQPSSAAKPDRRVDVAEETRNWTGHLVLFLIAQVVFAVLGHSWPLELLSGAVAGEGWFWNSAGHWMTNVSRIWCWVFLLDTLWTWGGVCYAKLARSSARPGRRGSDG